ncbi:hypothetical protein L1887_36339 [Cichorium endivia]|nr:hypothetical protein L1887_36339 [Cichorium endivia]
MSAVVEEMADQGNRPPIIIDTQLSVHHLRGDRYQVLTSIDKLVVIHTLTSNAQIDSIRSVEEFSCCE